VNNLLVKLRGRRTNIVKIVTKKDKRFNMVSVMKRAKSMIAVPAECCDKTNYSRIINEAEK
jgi:hypothetical protein